MKVFLSLYVLLIASVASAEITNMDCRNYYEVKGVRTCLSSNDDPQKEPDSPSLGEDDPNAQDLDPQGIPAPSDLPTKGISIEKAYP